MKNIQENTLLGLLMKDAMRKKGSGTIGGKEISWDDAYQITLLPLQEQQGRIRKYTVSPEFADTIKAQLSQVNWGSYISLEIGEDGKTVTAVEVICDWAETLSVF